MTESKTLNTLTDSLRKYFPDAVAFYVFGSRANGTASPESDYDLAVLLPYGEKIDPLILFNHSLDISASINKDIDLIDLNASSTVLAFQVVMNGKPFYNVNKLYTDLFETRIMSMYQRLNEERKEILNDLVTVH